MNPVFTPSLPRRHLPRSACVSEGDVFEISSQTIQDSQVAKVEGDRVINVSSGYTGVQYEYSVSSNQHGKLCCIGLSISKDLEFRPLSLINENDLNKVDAIIKKISALNEIQLREFLQKKPSFVKMGGPIRFFISVVIMSAYLEESLDLSQLFGDYIMS